MSNQQKPENEHAERAQEEIFFRKICENINKLSPRKYAELRTWLLMQPTIGDWNRLMSS